MNTEINISGTLHERFLACAIPQRFGNVASELARVSTSASKSNLNITETAIRFSQEFIEWTAPDLLHDRFDNAARLVEIQRALTLWRSKWKMVQENHDERAQLAVQARQWSDEVLKMSGLLDQE